jgi:hypothetical protein
VTLVAWSGEVAVAWSRVSSARIPRRPQTKLELEPFEFRYELLELGRLAASTELFPIVLPAHCGAGALFDAVWAVTVLLGHSFGDLLVS